MEDTDAGRLGYRPVLDGIRGVAILAVLGRHFQQYFIASGGYLGVDLFFVLSGFLITTLLLEEWTERGTVSFRRFYRRRALRLLPALFVVLGVCAMYATFALSERAAEPVWRGIWGSLGYASNWIAYAGEKFKMLGHTWSLSVEEQFYILWPLAVVLMLRRRASRRTIAWMIVSGIVASSVGRALLWNGHTSRIPLYVGTHTRADSLLMGCLIAVVPWRAWLARHAFLRRGLPRAATASALLLGALMVFIPVDFVPLYLGMFTAVAVASALIIVHVLHDDRSRLARALSVRPLVWVGRRSYGLYLWHLPVAVLLKDFFPSAMAVAGPWLCWTVSLAVADLSYRYVELPFLRRKSLAPAAWSWTRLRRRARAIPRVATAVIDSLGI